MLKRVLTDSQAALQHTHDWATSPWRAQSIQEAPWLQLALDHRQHD